MINEIIKKYNTAVFDTDRKRALEIVEEAIKDGVTPEEIIYEVVIPSLNNMIKSISENYDANLAQHFMVSQIASEITEMLVPQFNVSPEVVGTIVIGTAFGDMHSLGKKIIGACLRSNMINVVDIGVNVTPEQYVDAALSNDARVIGISSMMMHTATSDKGCSGVRKILKQKNLESKIKIIVGGAPFRFDDELYKEIGADAFANDGVLASEKIKILFEKADYDNRK